MTTKPNDGWAAFPSITTFFSDKTGEYELERFIPGMSLRDYFAAQALTGIMSITYGGSSTVTHKITGKENVIAKDITNVAYEIADCMLAERGKEK